MVPSFPAALALLLCFGLTPVTAQTPAAAKRPDPADAQATVPLVVYRSALPKAAPPAEVPVGSWSKANETVARIGGWRTYAREASAPAASQPGARP